MMRKLLVMLIIIIIAIIDNTLMFLRTSCVKAELSLAFIKGAGLERHGIIL